MPKVINMHHVGKILPEGAVYVGRPSKWGNSHPIGFCQKCSKKHSRAEAIEAFIADPDRPSDEEIERELRGVDCACWCAPLPCHADYLIEVANHAKT